MLSLSGHTAHHLLTITILLTGFVSPLVNAQHSDIWLVLDGNQTAVSPIDLETLSPTKVDWASGNLLFTGDFDDIGQGPTATDDPGFQSEPGTFNAGAILNFRAVEALQFWNGTAWGNTVADQERIQIVDALSSITSINSAGIISPEGAIDQIAGDGSVHQHVDFSIDNAAGSGAIASGAYRIELELYLTDGVGGPMVHSTSQPVSLVFNYQLTASEFASAINQLTQPQGVNVPIPGIMLFFFAGLLAIIAGFSRSFNPRDKELS